MVSKAIDRQNATDAESRFNERMRSLRVHVEFFFNRLKSLWAFLIDHRQMKLAACSVEEYIRVAALLTNIHKFVPEHHKPAV